MIKHIPEDIIDEGLKDGWTVDETERHDPIFVVP